MFVNLCLFLGYGSSCTKSNELSLCWCFLRTREWMLNWQINSVFTAVPLWSSMKLCYDFSSRLIYSVPLHALFVMSNDMHLLSTTRAGFIRDASVLCFQRCWSQLLNQGWDTPSFYPGLLEISSGFFEHFLWDFLLSLCWYPLQQVMRRLVDRYRLRSC